MVVYLVRHGEAVDRGEDPARPLTPQGRSDVQRVAGLVQRAGIELHQIRHSGKRRAAETAVLLGEFLQPAAGVVAVPGLAPGDDVHALAKLLQRETQPLMFVGHLPFLERLVSLLVTGEPGHTVVRFEKGSIVCLVRDALTRTWVVEWAVTPELTAKGE